MNKLIFGVGFNSGDKYTTSINRKITKQYSCWHDMMRRCYSEKYHIKYSTYSDCSVCKEWHNFQTFAEWYDENFYILENWNMALDKDILVKGNKVYSPKTCIFVPQNINCLFIIKQRKVSNLPIGVSKEKGRSKYKSLCSDGKKKIKYLGFFDTPKKAFDAYKVFKENLVKEIADTYKLLIPQRLYNAMYKYEIEITD